ncbi:hypothetical protein [Liquorilactobacillus satsumensis]|uniref:hypothetical protein n=1 Tax=Liquorilactobacillus satsumensis TaxID=259059 RepID=UPI0039ED2BDF
MIKMKELIHDEGLQIVVRQKILNDQVILRSWQWQETKSIMLVLVKQTQYIGLLSDDETTRLVRNYVSETNQYGGLVIGYLASAETKHLFERQWLPELVKLTRQAARVVIGTDNSWSLDKVVGKRRFQVCLTTCRQVHQSYKLV